MRVSLSWLGLVAGLGACGAEPGQVSASPPAESRAIPIPNHVLTEADAGGALRGLEAGDRITVRLRGGPWTQVAAPTAFLSPIGPPQWEGEVQVFAYVSHAAGRGQLVFAAPQARRMVFALEAR